MTFETRHRRFMAEINVIPLVDATYRALGYRRAKYLTWVR